MFAGNSRSGVSTTSPGAERQRERGEVDPEARVRRERDLGASRADQPSRSARATASSVENCRSCRQPVWRGAQLRELARRRRPRAAGADPCDACVEVDRIRRPRPTETRARGARRRRSRSWSRSVGRRESPRRAASLARMARGSSASRSASPSRLKPSTAAPIARPGTTDVHGACAQLIQIAAVGDHRPPARRRRLHAEAEERQRRLRHDRAGDAERRGDHDRRDDARQHVPAR